MPDMVKVKGYKRHPKQKVVEVKAYIRGKRKKQLNSNGGLCNSMPRKSRSAAAKKAWRTRKRKYGKDGQKG